MDWRLLTPQTLIYLQNRHSARNRQNYLLSLSQNLSCVCIYYPFTSRTSAVTWGTAAGVGREFMLTVQWSHQENFSCGANTSLSEPCPWIEVSNSFTVTLRGIKQLLSGNSCLPGLCFKQSGASKRCYINSEINKKRKEQEMLLVL